MAVALEGRHGVLAIDVAEFFCAFHYSQEDAGRAAAWAMVAAVVRQRQRAGWQPSSSGADRRSPRAQ